jgi:ABC-type multidrug transport system fused ATPase/permease subunit
LQQLRTILSAGDRTNWVALGLIVVLGLWPGIEVWLVKQAVNFIDQGSRNDAVVSMLVLTVLGIVTILLYSLHPYYLRKVKDRIYERLSMRLFGVVDRTAENDMIRAVTRNKLANSSESVSSLYYGGIDGFAALLQTMLTGLALTWVLLLTAWWAPALILAGALLNVYLTKKAAAAETRFLDNISETVRLESAYMESLTSYKHAKEIRVFGLSEWLRGKWLQEYRIIARQTIRHAIRSSSLRLSGNLSGGVVTLIVLLTGLWRFYDGSFQSGDISALLVGGLHLEQLLNMVLSQGKQWLGRKLYLAPLFREEMAPDSVVNEPDKASELLPGLAAQLIDVTFSYEGRKDALRGINLEVPRGLKLAVVGPNGSGKSTLMHVMSGILKPDSGTVRTDEIGGFCLQDYGRYKLSVEENIVLGDIYRQDAAMVESALRHVRADFIASLPERERTLLWPEIGGVDLSEGQWQRIAMARSLYRSFYRAGSIIILDEPTSSLDPAVELELLTSMMDQLRDYTVVFVIHRLVGCAFADQVLVMEQGAISYYGSHEQLLRTSPIYQEMWKASSSFI